MSKSADEPGGGVNDRLRQYKNKALDSEEIRRRREEYTVQLRKRRREEHIHKRRTGSDRQPSNFTEHGEAMATSMGDRMEEENGCPGQDPGVSSTSAMILSIDEKVKRNLYSSDPDTQFRALNQVRRLLSREPNPPIQEVIDSGIVPLLVDFLKREDTQQLQFESAWALTNIASGTQFQTEVVVTSGAVSLLIGLLDSKHRTVREQAVWALGNIAGDSPPLRDNVIVQGVMQPLLRLIQTSYLQHEASVLQNAVWCLSNMCRGKNPPPDFQHVSQALPLLARLLFSDDPVILTDTCWSISYLADGPDTNIQLVVDSGVARGLVRLLTHSQVSVVSAALRAVGNIVTGDDVQTEVVVNCGVLASLYHLLNTQQREALRKEACWALSNITAGNKKQIQAVIDANLVPLLVEVLTHAEFKTRKEAAWAISNAASGGSPEQVDYLVQSGCLGPLCRLTTVMDTRVIMVALNGVENILRVGQTIAQRKGLTQSPYLVVLEESGGLEHIEYLQSHENREIYLKAFNVIDKYFSPHDEGITSSGLDPDAGLVLDLRTSQQSEQEGVRAPSNSPFHFERQDVPSQGFSF